ncbi:phenylalanyl-tRNA synthetase subunit beta [Sorangium cellulosum]|uniref:Phenylalanine--tRNA ligase beta subunit n=1 Tax=Sorangium cellulosum TaxID=56 RepID=A0A2L0ETP3_SORCE|nr:phenylalanine--tRNA ligase subunit beta [Sorangium cellulosum]AUX42660.1 phenylalanyl-tRNA synthetase subunit beta [Sorangium cellulosum]
MLISYKWLQEILGFDPGAPAVTSALGRGGLEVDRVTHVGAALRPVVLASVVATRPHPNKKGLTLVRVDAGGAAAPDLEVVCGASNIPDPGAGALVCYAPVGAQVLDRTGAPITLTEKAVAGVTSAGMLCAEDELGLGSSHEGLLTVEGGRPGQSLLDWEPRLEDWIIELSVTPNRPDALGHLGVARDVAAVLGAAFTPKGVPAPQAGGAGAPAAVEVLAKERCPRYAGQVIEGVNVGPSPLWARVRLSRLGVRPITNLVDATNLVMLERGQPLHAFDLDTLRLPITIRTAKAGETFVALDGQKLSLGEDDLVIADAERVVALAGVIGGADSGVTATTRRVFLESAYFEPRGIRRSARRYGFHTEASHRFEREVDLSGIPAARDRATAVIGEVAGGAAAGEPIDVYVAPRALRRLTLRLPRYRRVIGNDAPERTREILATLGIAVVEAEGDQLLVEVPAHRPDIVEEIDLIEEVARVAGYDQIPSRLPRVAAAPAGARGDYRLRRRVRQICTGLGLHEAVTYSFLSPQELKAARYEVEPLLRLVNPLSEEKSVMRPSLVPGLLTVAQRSQRYNVPRVRLFEVSQVFLPRQGGAEGGNGGGAVERPPVDEPTRLTVLLLGPRDSYLSPPEDVDFYDGKGVVAAVLAEIAGNTAVGLDLEGEPPPWAHPKKGARVTVDGRAVGHVAELHPDVRDALELTSGAVVAEIDLAAAVQAYRAPVAAKPSRFPAMRHDVALLLSLDVPAGQVLELLRTTAGEHCEKVELFDRYRGSELPAGTHSLAFALWFRSPERTLTDDEVDRWTKAAVDAAKGRFGAQQR